MFLMIGLLTLSFSQQIFAEELGTTDYSLLPKNNHVRFLTKEEISFKLVQDYRFSPLMGVATPSVGIAMNPSIGMDKKIVPKEGWLKDMIVQDAFTSITAPDYSLKLENFPFVPSFGLHSFDGRNSIRTIPLPNLLAVEISDNKGSTKSLVVQNQKWWWFELAKKGNFF